MRIDKLLNERKPKKKVPNSLKGLYEWEDSEDGQHALDDLYSSDERAEKMMEEHRKSLKEHGILPSSS